MKIAIFGAGSTGCYLAGELLMAKLDVSLICRERIKRSITDNQGITLTSYQGLHQKVMPNALFTEVEADTPKFDLIFVT